MYNCGLVLEGGGNRGIFTSGVLDAFMENDITFPYIIGVSAGSCNAVSYTGKCHRRQHDITVNYCGDKRYMGINSLIKNGEYMNSGWLFGELSYKLMPLDYEAYENSGTTVCVVVTNAATGKPEYMYPKSLREYGCPIIRASCSMPIATKGTDIGGVKYFDGGVSNSIPLKRAYEDGCKKAVVILTQDKLYFKQPLKYKGMAKTALKKFPLLADALINRHEMYNSQKRFIEEEESKGNIFVIRPPVPLNCSSVNKDPNKLEVIYQLGYQQGMKHLEAIKKYLTEE